MDQNTPNEVGWRIHDFSVHGVDENREGKVVTGTESDTASVSDRLVGTQTDDLIVRRSLRRSSEGQDLGLRLVTQSNGTSFEKGNSEYSIQKKSSC